MNIEYTLDEVESTAIQIINSVKHKIILFYGEMGSGKTTLIKSIVKNLGVKHITNSPTFSLVNEYDGPKNKIYHFDLYRIRNLEEALDFGIEEYLREDCWILIEWPEVIEPLLSDDIAKIYLEVLTDHKRKLAIK